MMVILFDPGTLMIFQLRVSREMLTHIINRMYLSFLPQSSGKTRRKLVEVQMTLNLFII